MLSALTVLALAGTPELALLSSSGDVGELRFQPLGSPTLAAPVVRFTHAEGSPVQGTLLPGTRQVVATAVMQSGGDVSFGSSLLLLERNKSRVLADQVVYGSKPLVSDEGRVFVSRGRAGKPDIDSARTDFLTVEEIDPVTAANRVVYSAQGFLLYLVGALGREVLIYEVNAWGGRLIAVHRDTLGVRVIAGLVPMARDFVVDAAKKRVVFTQWGVDQWEVHQVSVVDGAKRVLAAGPEVTLLPSLHEGRVLISRGEGQGLVGVEGGDRFPAQGKGFERLLLERHGWLIGLHERPSDFPSLLVFQKGVAVPTAAPSDARLFVAGVVP